MLSNYQFVTKQISDEKLVGGNYEKIDTIMIGIVPTSDSGKKIGNVFPTLYSMFVTHMEESGKSLNSQISAASKIVYFLNFVTQRARQGDQDFESYREKGVFGLTRLHGAKFITFLTLEKESAKETVQAYEWALNRFYHYLIKMGWIEEKFEFRYIDGKKESWPSIFKNPKLHAQYPSSQTQRRKKAKKKDFGEDRYTFIFRFLEIARKVAPRAAFAFCLMFFGGLRKGEVVNITMKDIKAIKGESLSVQIRDNRRKLFGEQLHSFQTEFPKRLNYLGTDLANQTILDNDLLWEIYEEHELMIKSLDKQGKIRNKHAYFINAEGNAMSGQSLDDEFRKVKQVFLNGDNDHVGLVGHPDYDAYTLSRWGCHICRGVFTNILIDMGLSITQIAIARGDTSIESVMDYVDRLETNHALKTVIEHLNAITKEERDKEIQTIPLRRMGQIDNQIILTCWKNGVYKRAKGRSEEMGFRRFNN